MSEGEPTIKSATIGRTDELPLLFPPGVQDIAVDGFQGVSETNGLVRINMFRVRSDPDSESAIREIVVTLSMASRTVAQFRDALADWLKKREALGESLAEISGGTATKA